MNYEIKPLSVNDMREYGAELLQEHYLELCTDKWNLALNVNWDAYYALEKASVLFTLGIWNDDKLAGYSVFVVTPSMHYKDAKFAMNDVFIVGKEHRNSGLGLHLIQETEKGLASLGVDRIIFRCKYGFPLGDVLKRLDYTDCEYEVWKKLG